MIVAQEKTGYYGFSSETPRPKKTLRRKSTLRGPRIALTGLILAGFLVGVLITYYCSQVLALGYQIGRLEKDLALLRIENYNLDEEVHRLASLERVESQAVSKLGMVKPDSNNVLIVAVSSKTLQTPDLNAKEGNVVGISPLVEEKSRLIRAFTELVNRLENKIWLGCSLGTGSVEGTNANNQYFDPEKNNLALSYCRASSPRTNFSPGLASAC